MSKMYEKEELSKRMKVYENVTKPFLTLGTPKVIRVDMRAGSTFCKKLDKPFDYIYSRSMLATAKALCAQIPGAKFAYTQSDEISIALNDDFGENSKEFHCFFDGNLEKIVSISASIATLEFNKAWVSKVFDLEFNKAWTAKEFCDKFDQANVFDTSYREALNREVEKLNVYKSKINTAMFDSRVTVLPTVTELHNYFVWRQQDATRNSILALAYANFTTKETDNKNCSELQDMLVLERGINWNDLEVGYKRGFIICREAYEKENEYGKAIRHRWVEYPEIPIFTQDTNFIPELFNSSVGLGKELEEQN